MSNIVSFNQRNVDLGNGTRQEKIETYINIMGGPKALLDYILLNLKITEDNISDAELIEDGPISSN